MLSTRHKTKIVATVGPASDHLSILERMIQAGMAVARINLAHGNQDSHSQTIEKIRQAAQKVGHRVAILADLPGPKLRIGTIDPDPIQLQAGDPFILTTEDTIGSAFLASVGFPQLPQAVAPGDPIFLNDGFIELRVESVEGNRIRCRIIVGGELRSHKGINIPKLRIPLTVFTNHDEELLEFACSKGADAISISFVACADDVNRVRNATRKLGLDPFLIAKIERAAALENIDAILEAADGIMVARGDLGVETAIETIALTQKRLIRKANLVGKPVITATQMLESMVDHNRPTRAEATDVANAVLDGTDAVMLSEESALGNFPVEAVRMLGQIAHHAEYEHSQNMNSPTLDSLHRKSVQIQDVISLNVVTAVQHLGVKYIFTPTETGTTSRRIARFHLPGWIIALSPHPVTCQQLLFSYGILPVCTYDDTRPWDVIAREWLREHRITKGPVVITQGPSRGHPGGTNRLDIIDLEKEIS